MTEFKKIYTRRRILMQFSNVEFDGSPLSGFAVVAYRQTDILVYIDLETLTGESNEKALRKSY
jgi:hypothetical protein